MSVVGAVLAPNLRGVVEYLFPIAPAGFLAVGIHALRLDGNDLVRIITTGRAYSVVRRCATFRVSVKVAP